METRSRNAKSRNDLVESAQQGDIKAFHKLFSKFQDKLKSYLYRIIADRNDVDDIVQDTFVRAFDKIGSFRGLAQRENCSFPNWKFF